MGHYASEMDPSWGETPEYERLLNAVEDLEVRQLAWALFRMSRHGAYSFYESSIAEDAIRVAEKIVDR